MVAANDKRYLQSASSSICRRRPAAETANDVIPEMGILANCPDVHLVSEVDEIVYFHHSMAVREQSGSRLGRLCFLWR